MSELEDIVPGFRSSLQRKFVQKIYLEECQDVVLVAGVDTKKMTSGEAKLWFAGARTMIGLLVSKEQPAAFDRSLDMQLLQKQIREVYRLLCEVQSEQERI